LKNEKKKVTDSYHFILPDSKYGVLLGSASWILGHSDYSYSHRFLWNVIHFAIMANFPCNQGKFH
jgi:hypothetical protein